MPMRLVLYWDLFVTALKLSSGSTEGSFFMLENQKILLKVKGLQMSFVDRIIFENINFDIKQGERIGLVGYNGTGKTTLANILFGNLAPDSGTIEMTRDCQIGYLTQSIDYKFSNLHDTISLKGEILEHTSQLGLNKVQLWEEERLDTLSGGEKLKLALSMVWATNPGFLILDEPTNHLDLKGVEWLVSEIEKFNGPVLIISHDRHFLDQTVKKVFELEDRKLHFYDGNYTDYRKEKQKRFEIQQHQYTTQQRYKQKIELQMDQLKNWSDKAHRDSTKQGSASERRQIGFKEYHRVKAKKMDIQVKSKMKRLQSELEKNKIEKPLEETKVQFEFNNHGKRGKRIIEAKGLKKSFKGTTLFQHTNFYINQGERIGLFGENGCGKTTLIKMLLNQEPVTSGELWKSPTLKIAYLSQDVTDLQVEKNTIDSLGLTIQAEVHHARTLLANLGLKEDIILKPVSTLSLGERTRVKLVDMLMKEYDVLILDEPTNHLDLPAREQLEKTLDDFSGTIITVSHDFYFLNKLCDRLLVFENQKIRRLEMKAEELIYGGIHKGNRAQELMVIENRIATVLGELSLIDPKNPRYVELDQEFNKLLKEKRSLLE
jgi:macrolide transport system ATP-binding/permease protein